MIKELVFATNNANKVAEIKKVLGDLFEVISLKDAGIEVEYGILEKECRALNKRFFTFHEKKRPYVILKWAQTQDGFISHWSLPQDKEDNWITGKESKALVHQWRAQEQAILIGYNTLILNIDL